MSIKNNPTKSGRSVIAYVDNFIARFFPHSPEILEFRENSRVFSNTSGTSRNAFGKESSKISQNLLSKNFGRKK
mgnify:CR=1 FL=1